MKLFSILVSLPLIALTACASKPVNVVPINDFKTDRYLGTWYEVARLDHVFERGLTNVTANYTKRDDGKITVLNRGYNQKSGKYEEAKGKAKFASEPSIGHLKVSFFGPFYGDYIIVNLDKADYSYAYVSGGKDNYLWLLSREPIVSKSIRQDFIKQSTALGYDTSGLIWVDHSHGN